MHENLSNSQDTCSKNPGRVFSEGAEPPEAGHHQSHSSGGITTSGDLETSGKCQLLVITFQQFCKTMSTFQFL